MVNVPIWVSVNQHRTTKSVKEGKEKNCQVTTVMQSSVIVCSGKATKSVSQLCFVPLHFMIHICTYIFLQKYIQYFFFYLMAEVHFYELPLCSVLWLNSKHFVPLCTCGCQLKSKALDGYFSNISNSCIVVPNLTPHPIYPWVSGKRSSYPFVFEDTDKFCVTICVL